MAFKFVLFFAFLAAANAGGLHHHAAGYTQYHGQSVDESQKNHQTHYSQEVENHSAEGSHIHYLTPYAKTVHIAVPVESAKVYSGPAYTHIGYGGQAFARSLGYTRGPSSTPSSHASEDTTTAEPTTTESSTVEAENTEEITHAESEPTKASYKYDSATPTGYSYNSPSASSSSYTHTSGVPTFIKYHTSSQHPVEHSFPSPSAVKYEVPAQNIVKYAAPTHYAAAPSHFAAPHQTVVHYSAPAQAIYHKSVAPEAVHVKQATPVVYTSFGEHSPAVYSHYTAPTTTVHHTYAAPQPSVVKYTAPASGHVTYVAPAPAVYTKYGVTESAQSHVAPAPTAFIKYGAPTQTTYTTYAVPQHSTTKLVKYEGPAFNTKTESHSESQSSSSSSSSHEEENKDTIEIKSSDNTEGLHQNSRAYLPPATHLVSHSYPVPAEQYSHQESARTHSNEHNIWSTDGAASHVSFKGFGTSYAY